MDINRADIRIIGFIWLIISFWLPVSILASREDDSIISEILKMCASAAMVIGFISGIGLIFLQRLAAIILKILSWIYALSLFVSTIFIIIESASMLAKGNMIGIIYIPAAAMIFFLGVLSLLMGKYLKDIYACLSKQNFAYTDVQVDIKKSGDVEK